MGYDDLTTQTFTGATEPGVYSPTVAGPVDGYRAFAASVNTGLQTLINNDAYLKEQTDLIPPILIDITNIESYNPRFEPVSCAIDIYSGIWDCAQNTSATTQVWRRDVTSGYLNRGMINGQAHTTDVGKLFMFVPTYNGRGAYIQSITASIYGPNSTLPENMPYIKLYHTVNTGTPASVICDNYIGGVDTSADTAAFIQRHDIYLSWASGDRPAIDPTDGSTYFLELSPGWGASHVSGLNLVNASVYFTNEE